MKARVRLLGTLPEHYPGTYPESGLEVEIWEDICVAELVELVQLPQECVALVSINGMLSKAQDTIPDGAEVKLLQSVSGG